MKIISSVTNPLIKSVVRLHTTSERDQEGLFIVEGLRALRTVLSKLPLQVLYCTDKMLHHAQELTGDDKIILVDDAVMKKISTAHTPSGLLGILPIPQEPREPLTPGLVLAEINDPGNMGALIRTAAACKVTSLVVIGGCDPWSPKVIQATAGTIVHLNMYSWSWEKLIASKQSLLLYALVAHKGQSPEVIDSTKALLIIGNEARGISRDQLAQCDISITLPMPGRAESLNAAVAGSIATYITFVKTV